MVRLKDGCRLIRVVEDALAAKTRKDKDELVTEKAERYARKETSSA